MSNPPDAAKPADQAKSPSVAKSIGMVSLGCPKALVDSERILTRLRGEGYQTVGDYANADAVIVNTCAFLDSAREESLEAIAEARASGRPVIVTGCMGSEEALIRDRFPDIAAVTGAQAYDAVVAAVHRAAPQPFTDITEMPDGGLKLTPKHYAYLKISEGCDHRCSFCIIPSLRGDLASRPVGEVLKEAEALVGRGVKELLVVAQDTSAYGLDIRYRPDDWRGQSWKTNLEDLARGLGELGVWTRLHYIYPYPHVNAVIPLMAEGKILPYLDIPFQHASPSVLKAMKRPANFERTLERIASWRSIAPKLTLRSTFVVGFPGETEADFDFLLQWLEEAQLDRVGCFAYENVKGAAANHLPDHVPEEIKQDRRARLMTLSEKISRARLKKKMGHVIDVLVDQVRPDGVAIARSGADAPEIDGVVYVRDAAHLKVGEFARVRIERTDAFDMQAAPVEPGGRAGFRPTSASQRMHRVISRI